MSDLDQYTIMPNLKKENQTTKEITKLINDLKPQLRAVYSRARSR